MPCKVPGSSIGDRSSNAAVFKSRSLRGPSTATHRDAHRALTAFHPRAPARVGYLVVRGARDTETKALESQRASDRRRSMEVRRTHVGHALRRLNRRL